MAASQVDRPRVFLDVSIDTEAVGRLTMELFTDKTPKTCENFRSLCTGTEAPLAYKRSIFHRVIEDFMIQGGDTTHGDGTGGASIYDGEFDDENLDWREMDAEGLVCMANHGKDTNSSQFFITLAPCPHLNGKHTIFGRLVTPSSTDTLHRISAVSVDNDDKPVHDVTITHSGELVRRGQEQKPSISTRTTTNRHQDQARRGRRDESSNPEDGEETNDSRGRHTRSGTNTAKRQRSHSATSVRSAYSHTRSSTSLARTAKQTKRHHNNSKSISPERGSASPARKTHPRAKDHERRRSDQVVDEGRRGRERRRGPAESKQRQHSLSRSPGSHSRSRSRSRGIENHDENKHHNKDTQEGHYGHGYRRRRSLPNHYERVRELERERGISVQDVDMEQDGGRYRSRDRDMQDRRDYGSSYADHDNRSNDRNYRPSYREDRRDGNTGRLGGDSGSGYGGAVDDPPIKFKGRGSMKYRERESWR